MGDISCRMRDFTDYHAHGLIKKLLCSTGNIYYLNNTRYSQMVLQLNYTHIYEIFLMIQLKPVQDSMYNTHISKYVKLLAILELLY